MEIVVAKHKQVMGRTRSANGRAFLLIWTSELIINCVAMIMALIFPKAFLSGVRPHAHKSQITNHKC